jgi:NTP pyrophosphatase (non-canonical NTP hydrolase)
MCSLRDLQKRIEELFFEKDWRRGVEGTFLWFVEEVGELSEAILKKDKRALEEEIADVLAWLLSLANLLEVDLCEVFERKWGVKGRERGSA